MAIIGKIRQRSWILVGFIAAALFIFILEAALDNGNSLFRGGGGKDSVGKIGGSTISGKEYSENISSYEEGLKLINPNLQLNEQLQSQIQEEVWNTMAAKKLLG